jgi:ubiquinone/menaquinone biosynthesis C-methylase UbiE
MTGERMAAAYDRIAAEYAAINAALPPALVDIGGRFLARLGPDGRVLDVGCGAGRDMAWMEAQGAQVTGVDLSPGMLAQAQRIVRGTLLLMDMCRLALPAEHFDGVWCCASLLHVPKVQAPLAVAEMRRVLVPGGMLFLGVQEGEGEVWETAPYGHGARFFARYTPDEVAGVLSTAGFTMIEQGRGTAGTRRWLNVLASAPMT